MARSLVRVCLPVFSLLFVAGTTACFEEEVSVAVYESRPGPVAVQGLRSVAVAPLQGQTGKTLATALTMELARETGLVVVEQEAVMKALAQFGGRALTSSDWARLARNLGVDAVFYGIVQNEAVDETFDAYADANRGDTTYHRYVDATLTAGIWAVDRHGRDLRGLSVDGSLAHDPAGQSVAVGIHNQADAVFDALFPMVDPQAYMGPAAQRVAQSFVQALRPTYLNLSEVILYGDSSSGDSQRALDLARGGHWRDAAMAYQQGLQYADQASTCVVARLYYNLGVCLTQDGDTQQGRIALLQARSRGRHCGSVAKRIEYASQTIRDAEIAAKQATVVGWSNPAGAY